MLSNTYIEKKEENTIPTVMVYTIEIHSSKGL